MPLKNNDRDYIPSDDNDSAHGSCHNQEVSDEKILTLPESSVKVSSTMNESNSNKNQCGTITAEIAVSSDNSINNNISVTKENELTKKGAIRKRKRYALSVKELKQQKSVALAQLHGVLKESCKENCKKGRKKVLSEQQRIIINSEYWGMPKQEQKSFMFHHTSTLPVKQRTTANIENHRRQKSLRYFFSTTLGLKQITITYYIM